MVKNLMGWLEVQINTSEEHVNELSDNLTLLGAQALTTTDAGDQPIYEPAIGSTPTWRQTLLTGLFDSEIATNPIMTYLDQQQKAGLVHQFHLTPLADENWERRCLEDFKPIQIGQRLWIHPSWIPQPDPTGIHVILDPGLAFGTGTHPTTALCLTWLEAHVTPGMTVVDYGCGSGILSIAALKLGATHVVAVDHDPQALVATRQNAEHNQLTQAQLITCLPDQYKIKPHDLVIANILAQPLIELAPYFSRLVKPQGRIVLSGILANQAEQVTKIYQSWFTMQPPIYQQEWTLLTGFIC